MILRPGIAAPYALLQPIQHLRVSCQKARVVVTTDEGRVLDDARVKRQGRRQSLDREIRKRPAQPGERFIAVSPPYD